jgi:hypothetical protein
MILANPNNANERFDASEGKTAGWFSDGMAPSSVMRDYAVAIVVIDKKGVLSRRCGVIAGALDFGAWMSAEDEDEAVIILSTTIYFEDAPPMMIEWATTRVAMIELGGLVNGDD